MNFIPNNNFTTTIGGFSKKFQKVLGNNMKECQVIIYKNNK
jgi:hypothetical protein